MYKYRNIVTNYLKKTDIKIEFIELSDNTIACLTPYFQIDSSGNIHGKT